MYKTVYRLLTGYVPNGGPPVNRVCTNWYIPLCTKWWPHIIIKYITKIYFYYYRKRKRKKGDIAFL